MKRLLLVALFLALGAHAFAQTTVVTATLTDPQSVTWIQGLCMATWAGQGNPSTTTGQPFNHTPTCTVNSSGVMSVTVTDVAYIATTGPNTWNFCAAPGLSGQQQYNCASVAATGASESISTQLQAVLLAPSVTGGVAITAYADSEVAALPGNLYLNVGSSPNTLRCYATGAWGACALAGGGVSSVGLVGSGDLFSTTASTPVTGSGNLNVDAQLKTQLANCLVAGPSSGSAAAPTCRALVNADFPSTLAPTISGANLSALPTSPTLYPILNQSTTGNAATATALSTSAPALEVPAWLQFLGTGSDGANTTASGNMTGEYWYTNFTVPFGNTVTVNGTPGLVIHATGTCEIAGTINANGGPGLYQWGVGGGSGGGGSGGTAAGSAGLALYIGVRTTGASSTGGSAGGASGGNAGNGASVATYAGTLSGGGGTYSGLARAMIENAFWGQVGAGISGGYGGTGGSSGGAGGDGAQSVILICAQITGTDGTNVGTIEANGSNGGASTANNVGAGGGGGGGVIVLSSKGAVSTWPTLSVTGGSGGSCGAFTGCGTAGNGGAGLTAEFSVW